VSIANSGPDRLPRLTAVPAARSKAAALKIRFWVLLAALLFAAGAGVFAAVSYLTFQPPVSDPAAGEPLGLAIAVISAEEFLAVVGLPLPDAGLRASGTATGVPHAGPLAWGGFVRFSIPNGLPMESHRFLFNREIRTPGGMSASGELLPDTVEYQLMTLTVLVAVPAGSNPVLAALPYMAPANYPDLEIVADYSDSNLAKALPTPAVAQLRAWGEAWAADNSTQLRLLTGDQTSGVRYVGLGGYSLREIRVLSALEIGKDLYLARIRVVLRGANESILEMDMDLTITAASSGLPKVTGWGPAGSGIRTPADVRVVESG
jgi:hypothetical protein